MATPSVHLNKAALESLAEDVLTAVLEHHGILPEGHPVLTELADLTQPCRDKIDMYMLGARRAGDLVQGVCETVRAERELAGADLHQAATAAMAPATPQPSAWTALRMAIDEANAAESRARRREERYRWLTSQRIERIAWAVGYSTIAVFVSVAILCEAVR